MKRMAGKPNNNKETEDDAKSETSQSQPLSHEERQAVYEKTRARIFSDYVESQVNEPAKNGSDAGSESNQSRPISIFLLSQRITSFIHWSFFNEFSFFGETRQVVTEV